MALLRYSNAFVEMKKKPQVNERHMHADDGGHFVPPTGIAADHDSGTTAKAQNGMPEEKESNQAHHRINGT